MANILLCEVHSNEYQNFDFRSICTALLRHASNSKIVVRIENYRVIKKLMLVAKPNVVLNHFFDHMGDKRSLIREDVLNIVMYALLTFPSNEFDLKVCILLSSRFTPSVTKKIRN